MTTRKSNRGLIVYSENPSVAKMRLKNKPQTLTKPESKAVWVNEDSGECYDRAGLYQVIEVDNAPFVKLYADSVRAFTGLKKTAGRILEIVCLKISKEKDKDEVYLSMFDAENYGIKKTTFFNGVKQLCEKEILFESAKGVGWYFINVNFIFNGDRLIIAKEYRRKRGKFQDPNQLKLL